MLGGEIKMLGDRLIMDIGIKIKLRRTELNLSQIKLAELAQMTQKNISEVEKGRRQLRRDEITHLSRALSVPQSWFLEDDESIGSIGKNNFSGDGTNTKNPSTTEAVNPNRLTKEISMIPPEQQEELWESILKIAEVVTQSRFKSKKEFKAEKEGDTELLLE